jgi:hypothetical protein
VALQILRGARLWKPFFGNAAAQFEAQAEPSSGHRDLLGGSDESTGLNGAT